MKSKWNKKWKSSKRPSKQRKYRYNIPLHLGGSLLSVNLSKELRKKYGKRNIRVRKGDKVKLMRGQFKKKTGEVAKISIKHKRVYVSGIEIIKMDGNKVPYPLEPSNLMITELNLEDKKRKKSLERK